MGTPRRREVWASVALIAALLRPADGSELGEWRESAFVAASGALQYRFDLPSQDHLWTIRYLCSPADRNVQVLLLGPSLEGPKRKIFITFNRVQGDVSQIQTVAEGGSAEVSEMVMPMTLRDVAVTVRIMVDGKHADFQPFGVSLVNQLGVQRCRL